MGAPTELRGARVDVGGPRKHIGADRIVPGLDVTLGSTRTSWFMRPCPMAPMKSFAMAADLWSRFHGTAERTRAATFGTFDGATSSYGVTFAMFAQHQKPSAFVAPVVGLAIASAAGMGGGEAETGGGSDLLARVVVMALHSFFGVVAVAIPFFYLTGTPALLFSLTIAIALGVVIAERRAKEMIRIRAYALTFGVLTAAIGVTSLVALALPGSGG